MKDRRQSQYRRGVLWKGPEEQAGDKSMSTHDISLLYEDLEPAQLIDLLLTDAKGPACITCSFQAEDVIVLHLLRRRIPDIPVLFLDTGYHFAETYAFRDRLTREWQLNLVN